MTDVFDDPLMQEFDATDVTPDALDAGGGGGVNKPGWAMFMISDITPFMEEGKLPRLRFQCHCMAHVDPSQKDKQLWHSMYLKSWVYKDGEKTGDMAPPSAESKLINMRFARGLGLITNQQLGQKVAVNWGLAKGRMFCCKVDEQAKKDERGKKIPDEFEYRIPYGRVYPPDSEQAAECPKDPEAMAIYKASGGGDSAGGGRDLDDV